MRKLLRIFPSVNGDHWRGDLGGDPFGFLACEAMFMLPDLRHTCIMGTLAGVWLGAYLTRGAKGSTANQSSHYELNLAIAFLLNPDYDY